MAKIKWERKPSMTIDDFVKANEWEFTNSYIESEPSQAYKINDGDLNWFYDWIQWRYDWVTDIMTELYQANLETNI